MELGVIAFLFSYSFSSCNYLFLDLFSSLVLS